MFWSRNATFKAEGDDAARESLLITSTKKAARYTVLQWAYWQMANLGPMMGNTNHFKNYAKHLVDDPAHLAYGTRRFVGEVDRLCGVMDAQLSTRRYPSAGSRDVGPTGPT